MYLVFHNLGYIFQDQPTLSIKFSSDFIFGVTKINIKGIEDCFGGINIATTQNVPPVQKIGCIIGL